MGGNYFSIVNDLIDSNYQVRFPGASWKHYVTDDLNEFREVKKMGKDIKKKHYIIKFSEGKGVKVFPFTTERMDSEFKEHCLKWKLISPYDVQIIDEDAKIIWTQKEGWRV